MLVADLPEPMYKVPEVARFWDIDPNLVYRMLGRGELRGIKIGRLWRIPYSAVEEYQNRRAVPEPGPPMPAYRGPVEFTVGEHRLELSGEQ